VPTPRFPQRQPPQRCRRPGPSRGRSLPIARPSFPQLRTSSPTTAGFPPSAMTSTVPPRNAGGDHRRGVQGLHDQQDPRMVPALGPSPFFFAAATPGSAWGGAGAATPNRRAKAPVMSDNVTTRKGQTSSRPPTIRRQPWRWRTWVAVETGLRSRAHAIQDFKTSARSSQAHLPRSPVQGRILTLKSLMIPYPKLGDFT
jgi:hypothetical protein